MTDAPSPPMSIIPMSIIVPAHDEASVIAATLAVLADGTGEVIVVCNGCSDDTADIARGFDVEVVEIDRASKTAALNEGDRRARFFPRFYVDADIVVSGRDLARAAERLRDGVHVVAPEPVADLDGSSWAVRAFYRVWTQLPYYHAMGGAGVLGVDRIGRDRFGEFPDVIADDEFLRLHMRHDERAIADVTCVVRAPRDVRSLVKVKTRGHLGRLELVERHPELVERQDLDHSGALTRMVRHPRRWLDLAIYLGVRVVARARAERRFRRGDLRGWERDLSTRS